MGSEAVERVVAAALDVGVRSHVRPSEGSVADTYRLELADDPGRAVCKFGGASVWTGDVIEPLVLRLVNEVTDLPVPAVLASGSIGLEDDPPGGLESWAIYEFRDGRAASRRYRELDPGVRRRIVAEAGAYLGELHAARRFDRVGGLAREGSDLRLRAPEGWHAIDPGAAARVPVPLAGDDGCRPVLCHGDYHPGNLLVDDDGRITAVLDWGNAHVTHAEYALARAECRFVDVHRFPRERRVRLRRLLRAEYARRAPLETAFDRRAPWYKLLWLAQSAANYARIVRSSRGRTQVWRQIRGLLDRR